MTTTTQQPTIIAKRSTLNPDDRILVVSPADCECIGCGGTLSERVKHDRAGWCVCESCGYAYETEDERPASGPRVPFVDVCCEDGIRFSRAVRVF
jgi:hypothetical protein